MKKMSEQVMLTLFFSSLSGVGLTAGLYFFIAVAHLLSRLLWGRLHEIDYQDKGAIATITITVFEFRKHNRVVDAALFAADVKAA